MPGEVASGPPMGRRVKRSAAASLFPPRRRV